MDQPNLLFLNTTGASSISQSAAKRMRAHITKTNFAKRRQRISNSTSPESEIEKNALTWEDPRQLPINNKHSAANKIRLNMTLPPVFTCSDAARDPKALHKLQSLVFLEGIRSPVSASEATWFNLIASDPALIESTMAIAVRLWSPDDSWQMKSYQHSCTAINLIKQRIASTMTSTDGVLGAVTTMAFGASLENDDVAWNVHIDGLAQILKERQSRGTTPPPSWLTDLVVQDSVNAIFNFPRLYHERILEILIECNDQRIIRIKAICDSVTQLQKMIDSHNSQKFESTLVAREIEEPLVKLHYELRALRAIDDAYVQATARSIELVLYLLWPSQSGAHLTLLAGELKETICLFPIQGCSYMNLTSFQLMIGAIAADENSPTRAWFFDRMAREARALQLRGWNEPLSMLQNRNMPAGGLTRQLQALWKELCHRAMALEH